MKLGFIKVNGGLAPFDDEAMVWFTKQKFGTIIRMDFSAMRNGKFFRKWWALVKYAFDNWDAPQVETKFGVAQVSFDRFRKDMIIFAGFYHVVVRADGSTRIEADSLKWGKMTEGSFDELYKNTVQAILTHVLDTHDEAAIELAMNEMAGFW